MCFSQNPYYPDIVKTNSKPKITGRTTRTPIQLLHALTPHVTNVAAGVAEGSRKDIERGVAAIWAQTAFMQGFYGAARQSIALRAFLNIDSPVMSQGHFSLLECPLRFKTRSQRLKFHRPLFWL